MKSHEFAKKLLKLENKELEIITKVDGQYVTTKTLDSPWQTEFDIRCHLVDDRERYEVAVSS